MIFFALLLKLGFNTPAADPLVRARYVMGTVCEIEAFGPHAQGAVAAAFEEIARLDRVMSLYEEYSELSAVNREASRRPVPLSPDLWAVLQAAGAVWRDSHGAFDPTAGSKPSGFALVRLDPAARAVLFHKKGIRLDLGGIGKGYALDAAAAVLRRLGVTSARLNFGGQILALGVPPGSDAWDVEMAGSSLKLRLRDRSVSVSSQSERPGHILAPATGRPVARAGSIAVIAADATTADAWSTALFVAGIEVLSTNADICAIAFPPGNPPIFAGDCGEYITSQESHP